MKKYLILISVFFYYNILIVNAQEIVTQRIYPIDYVFFGCTISYFQLMERDNLPNLNE